MALHLTAYYSGRQTVKSPGEALQRFKSREQIPVHEVPMTRRITPVQDMVALYRLVRTLRAVRPGIVHAHTPKGGLLGLLDAALAYVPAPADHAFKATRNGEETTITGSETAPYAAFVWKTVADPFAGRITMFRVVSGALKVTVMRFPSAAARKERTNGRPPRDLPRDRNSIEGNFRSTSERSGKKTSVRSKEKFVAKLSKLRVANISACSSGIVAERKPSEKT